MAQGLRDILLPGREPSASSGARRCGCLGRTVSDALEVLTVPVLPELDRQVRRNFYLDVASNSLSGLFAGFTLQFVPVVARRMEADVFLLAFILAAPYIGSIVTIFAGYLLPQRRQVLFAGVLLGLGRAALALVFFTTTPLQFSLVVLIAWVVFTFPNPLMVDLTRRRYPAENRGRLLGYVWMCWTMGATAGSVVCGWSMDIWSPQLLFPIGAVFGVLGAVAYTLISIPDEDHKPRFGALSTLRILREDRSFALYTAAWFVWGLGGILASPLYPIILVNRLSASYTQVGVLNFVTSAAWFLSYVFWGSRIDRLSPVRALMVSFMLNALVPIVYLVSPNVWYVAIASATIGFINGGIDLAGLNSTIQLAPQGRLPQYSALQTVVVGVRGVIAPFAGSALAASPWMGIDGVLVVASITTLLG